MAIVYIHKRPSNNEVFYVGIGKEKHRATSKRMRNRHWKFVVEKENGFISEIVFDSITQGEAYIREKELIAFYGRKDLGLGSLVNFTDGGEGLVNPSFEARNKIRIANQISKPWSEERKNNYVPPNKGTKGLQIAWNKGLKIPCTKERKIKLSKTTKGVKKKPFTEKHKAKLAFKKPRASCIFCKKEMSVANLHRHGHIIRKCIY